MPILTTSELARLRTDIAALLPDLCNVFRPTLTNTSYGGTTYPLTQINTAVPILLAVARPGNKLFGYSFIQQGKVADPERIASEAGYQITLPQSVDIKQDDVLIVTSLGNLRLRIVAVVLTESLQVVKQAGGRLEEDIAV